MTTKLVKVPQVVVVTCAIGEIEVSDDADGVPVFEAAMLMIARHKTDGKFVFSIPALVNDFGREIHHGATHTVTVETTIHATKP